MGIVQCIAQEHIYLIVVSQYFCSFKLQYYPQTVGFPSQFDCWIDKFIWMALFRIITVRGQEIGVIIWCDVVAEMVGLLEMSWSWSTVDGNIWCIIFVASSPAAINRSGDDLGVYAVIKRRPH